MRPSTHRGDTDLRSPLPALIIAVLVLLGSMFFSAASAEAGAPDDEAQFVFLVNEYRAEHQLPPLEVDFVLMATAQQWATVMSSRGAISHADDLSVGVPDGWAKLGENVGYAPIGQVDILFDAFVASPSHRANLLDEGFDRIGVAVVEANDGRIYTAHRFMETTEAQPLSAMERAHQLMTGTTRERVKVDRMRTSLGLGHPTF